MWPPHFGRIWPQSSFLELVVHFSKLCLYIWLACRRGFSFEICVSLYCRCVCNLEMIDLCYHLAHARCFFLIFLMVFFPVWNFKASSNFILSTIMFATFFPNSCLSLMLFVAESLNPRSNFWIHFSFQMWSLNLETRVRYYFLEFLLYSHMIQQSCNDLASSFPLDFNTLCIHSVALALNKSVVSTIPVCCTTYLII